jgi:hypothetical protein
MDTQKLIARVKNIILSPHTEWPVIAGESDTVATLYTRYILVLSAVPAVAGFIKTSLIGVSVPMVGTVRVGFGAGLSSMVLQYLGGLAAVYILALIVNALAPTFGGQKDPVQALKTTAYASTAGWIGGTLVLVPWLGWMLAMAGGIYSIYLLYLGLPSTMRSAADKSVGYTAVTVVIAIVLGLVLSAVVGAVTGVSGFRNDKLEVTSRGGNVTIDADSVAGQMDAWSKKMEAAGKKMEQAQKSGDQQAQVQAAGAMMGAMLGGGDSVEALSPEQLKPFVPDTLGEFPRTEYSAERNTMMGVQIAEAHGNYRDESGEHSVRLEITDMGGAKGLAGLAGWAMQESERTSDSGYERVYHEGERMVHEEWNQASGSGSYDLVIAQRFSVKLQGNGLSMDELKALAATLDLAGLEALKKSGVKSPG